MDWFQTLKSGYGRIKLQGHAIDDLLNCGLSEEQIRLILIQAGIELE